MLAADPNITDLLQEYYPEIPGGIGGAADNTWHRAVTY